MTIVKDANKLNELNELITERVSLIGLESRKERVKEIDKELEAAKNNNKQKEEMNNEKTLNQLVALLVEGSNTGLEKIMTTKDKTYESGIAQGILYTCTASLKILKEFIRTKKNSEKLVAHVENLVKAFDEK